jgi:uncharacterized protein YaiL (DUF2058 family)
MVSLQEQFLKAGLVDKNKVKLANQDKSKQKKVERRTGTHSVDEARLAALDTHDKKIERLYVSAAVQAHLMAGRLVIVCQGGATELVPRIIADKIAERDASLVVRVNKSSTEIDADDPYAAFQIPDDLMW